MVDGVERIPKGGLCSRAHAAQATGQPGGRILQPSGAQRGPHFRREPLLRGEERQPFPRLDKSGDALGFDSVGQRLILGTARSPLGRVV
jgi:hypothetical protein